ncbi:MAG: hypothetical protein AVDCRST_MAG25-2410, partial [uncultured Rubrobacteraceae bacterium]
ALRRGFSGHRRDSALGGPRRRGLRRRALALHDGWSADRREGDRPRLAGPEEAHQGEHKLQNRGGLGRLQAGERDEHGSRPRPRSSARPARRGGRQVYRVQPLPRGRAGASGVATHGRPALRALQLGHSPGRRARSPGLDEVLRRPRGLGHRRGREAGRGHLRGGAARGRGGARPGRPRRQRPGLGRARGGTGGDRRGARRPEGRYRGAGGDGSPAGSARPTGTAQGPGGL